MWFFIYWTSGVQPRGEPGRSVCPIKEPRRHSSAKNALNKRRSGQRLFSLWPLPYVCCGGVLLSHNLAVAVPLALPGLASRFGMEAGRFPGAMTTTSLVFNTLPPCWFVGGCGLIVVCIVVAAVLFVRFCHPNVCWVLFSVGPLVPVGSRAHCCASTSGLSTR